MESSALERLWHDGGIFFSAHLSTDGIVFHVQLLTRLEDFLLDRFYPKTGVDSQVGHATNPRYVGVVAFSVGEVQE
jgi:hypothetical protein